MCLVLYDVIDPRAFEAQNPLQRSTVFSLAAAEVEVNIGTILGIRKHFLEVFYNCEKRFKIKPFVLLFVRALLFFRFQEDAMMIESRSFLQTTKRRVPSFKASTYKKMLFYQLEIIKRLI